MDSVDELVKKVKGKKLYTSLPDKDVITALNRFYKNEQLDDEEKIKKTRDVLRRAFSGFAGLKLLKWKNATPEEILKKHLSTRERYGKYLEIYSRLLQSLHEKISIIDLGAGVNGLSYSFFEKTGKKVDYIGIEAVNELVGFMNSYFGEEKINGKALAG